jgi:hypothetical protein
VLSTSHEKGNLLIGVPGHDHRRGCVLVVFAHGLARLIAGKALEADDNQE